MGFFIRVAAVEPGVEHRQGVLPDGNRVVVQAGYFDIDVRRIQWDTLFVKPCDEPVQPLGVFLEA